jgi:hypothetical protein
MHCTHFSQIEVSLQEIAVQTEINSQQSDQKLAEAEREIQTQAATEVLFKPYVLFLPFCLYCVVFVFLNTALQLLTV